jgi:hypothetical protein
VLEAAAALLDDRTDYLRLVATQAVERARLEEASLETPTGLDSLLMHGRSSMPGGGMTPPSGRGGSTRAGATASGAQTEMR